MDNNQPIKVKINPVMKMAAGIPPKEPGGV